MSHQRSGTRVKITRVFLLLVILAAVKLVLFGVLGVETLTQSMVETVAPIAGVEEALAQTPAASPAEEAVAQTAEADQTEADGAALDGAVMETKPAGMDDSDWKVLKKREEELAAKERSLKELEAQLSAKTVEIEKLNEQLRQLLDEAKGVKDEQLDKLVKAYANMKAKSAAAVLETMNQDLAVKILSGLGGRQAGEILGFIETRKAAQLSEALTELRVPFQE